MISAKELSKYIKINWPLKEMVITQGYGKNKVPFYKELGMLGHNGLDLRTLEGIKFPKGERTCYASFPGTVTDVSTDSGGGKQVKIQSYIITINNKRYALEAIYYHLKIR